MDNRHVYEILLLLLMICLTESWSKGILGEECHVDFSDGTSNTSCGPASQPCKSLHSCLGTKRSFRRVVISGRNPLKEDLTINGNVSVIGRNNASIVSLTSHNSTRLVFLGGVLEMKNVRIEGVSLYMLGVRNISIESILFHKTRVKVADANMLSIDNCTFQHNYIQNEIEGGALNVESVKISHIKNCFFKDNQVLTPSAKGGAVFMKQINETTIRNCTFSDNIAKIGGAIHILARPGKTTLIDDCIFMANKAVIYEEQSESVEVKWSGSV